MCRLNLALPNHSVVIFNSQESIIFPKDKLSGSYSRSKHSNEKKERKIHLFLEHPRQTQILVKKKYTSILLKRILMNMLKYKFNAMFSHT